MIQHDDYPALVDFMKKSLYQGAAPTFDEAIRAWYQTGEISVSQVVRDVESLLAAGHPAADLDKFVERYSEYAEEDGGVSTLKRIQEVLSQPKG